MIPEPAGSAGNAPSWDLPSALTRIAVALERANYLKEIELTGEVFRLGRAGEEPDGSGLIDISDEDRKAYEDAFLTYHRTGAPPIPFGEEIPNPEKPNVPDGADVKTG